MKMFRSKKPVAVLGAGPSGLLAAQAAIESGRGVDIFSRPSAAVLLRPSSISTREEAVAKSELHGCQYLHRPVPSALLAGAGVKVEYRLEGTVSQYREKVYGRQFTGTVSPEDVENTHEAWDLRAMYHMLWDALRACMVPMDLTRGAMQGILLEKYSHVFVTVPAPALCYDMTHSFSSQMIWAMGQRTGTTGFPIQCPENTIVCNGSRDTGWYRMSNVFGHTTVEWATERKPPVNGVVRVEKPVSTTCDCWLQDDRVLRLGRFGQWQKGVLVHEVYRAAKAALR